MVKYLQEPHSLFALLSICLFTIASLCASIDSWIESLILISNDSL